MNERVKHLLALPDTPRYNIKAVVQQTQVNISTLRAWEQRYGVPRPKRSDHGHRLYSQRDVAIIKWLRQCTEEGLAISQAVQMLRDLDTEEPGSARPDGPIAPTPAAAPPNSAWPDIRAALSHHLAEINLRQAHLLVNNVCAMFPAETVILEIFEPIMVETGMRWTRGEICVAEEHVVSNFIRQRLLGLIQLHAPFAHGPRLICGCVPQEQHELGLLMFALLMEQRGWEVIYLGQSLSTEGLGDFLVRVSPAMISLSITLVEHMPGLLEMCKVIKSLDRHHLELTFSGHAFNLYPELRDRVPGIFLGTDLRSAVAHADELGEIVDPDRWYKLASLNGRANLAGDLTLDI
ncbi:MAG: MerR family transcriptional regulator [Kouleothrix sp.]|nr:MerR family transcriptional regulator [Kouleothrix sp.]